MIVYVSSSVTRIKMLLWLIQMGSSTLSDAAHSWFFGLHSSDSLLAAVLNAEYLQQICEAPKAPASCTQAAMTYCQRKHHIQTQEFVVTMSCCYLYVETIA